MELNGVGAEPVVEVMESKGVLTDVIGTAEELA